MKLNEINWESVIRILGSLLVSYVLVFKTIPTIIHIARSKGLLNKPDSRTSHRYSTPNMAGISIFFAFTIASFIFFKPTLFQEFRWIYLSMFIVFFAGLKDDILILSPERKLLIQFFAAISIIYGELRITNLHNFFSIGHVDQISSVLISLVIIIAIMNAFNLIDGIDGLAAIIGIITLSTFCIWFAINGEINWAIICTSLIGGLVAFFGYNVFGLRNKTFMGDCGSLVLGLVLACIVIKFNEMNIRGESFYPYMVRSAPAIAFGILIVPLFDTIRVFIIRLKNRTSPFLADRNHIHHKIIDLGFSHLQASLILGGINIFFIGISFLLKNIGIIRLGIILFVLALVLSQIPHFLLKARSKR